MVSPNPRKKKHQSPSALRSRIEKDALRDMYPPRKKKFIREG